MRLLVMLWAGLTLASWGDDILAMDLDVVFGVHWTTGEGGTATLSWTAPTERVDGSPLTNLAGYRVRWGDESLQNTIELADPALLTHAITGLPAGTHYFVMRAYDATGLESEDSNMVSKTFADPPPVPPVNLVVGQNTVVYTAQKLDDRIVLVPVGTAPPGTPCDGRQLVTDANGRYGYVVAREHVQWAGSVRPRVVFGCGP